MKTNRRSFVTWWLAGAVALAAVVSAGVLRLAPGPGAGWLDSRVTCEKLGPKACEPGVA